MKYLAHIAIPLMLLAAQGASSQTMPADHATAPDNTRSNAQDRSNRSASADHQSNSSTDLDVTKRIRQSIVADKGLSTYGHNVKVMSNGGEVTLNGVVRSDAEKAQIEDKAVAVVGKEHVVNHLKIATK